MVELGYADQAAIAAATDRSAAAGKPPEAILLERGEIDQEQLARAVAERNGLPFVDLLRFPIDDGALLLIDSGIARRYHAAPIAFDADGTLILALADPLNTLAVSDIGVVTKSEVRPAVATESGIEALLATMPDSAPRRLAPERADDAESEAPSDGVWTVSQSITTTEPEPDAPGGAHEVEPEPQGSSLPPLRSSRPQEQLAQALERIESLSARVEQLELESRALRQERDELLAESAALDSKD